VIYQVFVYWANQGKVHWNDDWVESRGYARSHIPGLDEHIGFANYDLRMNRLPEIQRNRAGRLYLDVDLVAVSGLPPNAGTMTLFDRTMTRIMPLLKYHGFEIEGNED